MSARVYDVEANNENTPLVNGSSNGNAYSGSTLNGDGGLRRESTSGISTYSDVNGRFRHASWPQYLYLKFMIVLKSNYVNWLMVFIPLGIAAKKAGWGDTAVFILNFLAIIPLASLLSFATEELALQVGQTLGGLLNATFGNAVELIVSPTWQKSYLWTVSDSGNVGQYCGSH